MNPQPTIKDLLETYGVDLEDFGNIVPGAIGAEDGRPPMGVTIGIHVDGDGFHLGVHVQGWNRPSYEQARKEKDIRDQIASGIRRGPRDPSKHS